MAKTIRMVRESDGKTADVHPAEVENFRVGGYVEATPETAETQARPNPSPKRGRPRKKRAD